MGSSRSTTDPLTGTADRAAFEDRFAQLLEHSEQQDQTLALLLIDLDHFKSVNDAFGHPRGDQVLIEFVRRVRSGLRSHDELFRLGGDEFVVLLPATSSEASAQIAQRLLEIIRSQPFLGEPPLTLTASVGVALYPSDSTTTQELFQVADRRSYQAKRDGRGRVQTSDRRTDEQITPPDRLIERDAALAMIHALIESIVYEPRGLLQISGAAGAGRSALIEQAARAAKVHSMLTITLRGDAALSSRSYGAFQRAESWINLPTAFMDPAAFGQALWAAVEQHSGDRLLILVDDADLIDRSSLELLRALIAHPALKHLAVITVDPGWTPERYLSPSSPVVVQHIILKPLSRNGMRAWLRHALRWEPPAQMLDLLEEITGGLPRAIEQTLSRLIADGALVRSGEQWIYHSGYAIATTEALILPAPDPSRGLPSDLGEFVGRVDELQRLTEMLPREPVIILHGPGGVGKSRLAIQTAIESAARFSGGAWWVSLTTLTSGRQIIPAIALALGLEVSRFDDPFERLIAALSDRPTLLVLDNLDSLGGDILALNDLRRRAPLVHLLMTAHILPTLDDALLFPVGGLSIPTTHSDTATEMSEAVQLFMYAARRVEPTYTLTDTTRPLVTRICQMVSGVPLGIELAAAQLSQSTIAEIADDIADNLFSPEGAERGGVSIMIERFWSLMNEYERLVLSRLGIFRGGFSAQAASVIADASPFFLHALTISRYLRRTPAGRYELHDLLQHYALQQLQQRPEEQQLVSDRHSNYFIEYAADRTNALLSIHSAHEDLRTEFGNIRAAWAYTQSHNRSAGLAAISLALLRFCQGAGLLVDQLAVLEETIDSLRTSGQGAPADLALLLAHRASAFQSLSRFDEAMLAAEEARTLAQTSGNIEAEAYAQLTLGRSLVIKTEAIRANSHIEEAIRLAQLGGLRSLEGAALLAQSSVVNSLRRYSEARTLMQHALAIFREINDRRHEAAALTALGNLCEDRGDPSAEQYFHQALALYRSLGDRDGESGVLHNLGVVYLLLARYAAAHAILMEALRGFAKLGSRFGEAITRYNLGRIARELGDWAEAEHQFGNSLMLTETIGNRDLQVSILNGLAQTSALQGDLSNARRRYAQALQLARSLSDQRSISRVLSGIALIEVARGRLRAARRAAQHALRLAETIDHTLFQCEALHALAETYAALGDTAQSEAATRRSASLLQSLNLQISHIRPAR